MSILMRFNGILKLAERSIKNIFDMILKIWYSDCNN